METQLCIVSVSYISQITIVLVPPVIKGVARRACVSLALSARCFPHRHFVENTGCEAPSPALVRCQGRRNSCNLAAAVGLAAAGCLSEFFKLFNYLII